MVKTATKRLEIEDFSSPLELTLDGKSFRKNLSRWRVTREEQGGDRTLIRFADPGTGLEVSLHFRRFKSFRAMDWVAYLANTGKRPTPLIENLLPLDVALKVIPYVLHRTGGAPSDERDFEVTRIPLAAGELHALGGRGGRSSNTDFPFFRIEASGGIVSVAVGWTGQWKATIGVDGEQRLHLSAGMESTRFRLLPGERVRTPRILIQICETGLEEAAVQFRRLLAQHYLPRYRGQRHRPFLYCNTCFTRGGNWLNECNEGNQISLIRALSPLGVEAVVTDAGWFTGGWPHGAGNWEPDPAKYPGGMAPVAREALEHGVAYGLWFEPERVVAGSRLDREHPEWVLWPRAPMPGAHPFFARNGIVDFGLPEAREHFLTILSSFFDLPGFSVYRQDFNLDPLRHWRDNDGEDRQGITEMKYVEGLYTYWDRIREQHPDCFMIGCAGGGRRIDLEGLTRFHVHQKSDHWFDPTVDQASLYGLSQWVPNGCIDVPVNGLSRYHFHSAMAATLNLGWAADEPGFDDEQAAGLCGFYRKIRPLLNKDWYPLTPYTRSRSDWLAVQFHDPEENTGLVLAFRREGAAASRLTVQLRAVDRAAVYTAVTSDGEVASLTGSDLLSGYELSVKSSPGSIAIMYKVKGDA